METFDIVKEALSLLALLAATIASTAFAGGKLLQRFSATTASVSSHAATLADLHRKHQELAQELRNRCCDLEAAHAALSASQGKDATVLRLLLDRAVPPGNHAQPKQELFE